MTPTVNPSRTESTTSEVTLTLPIQPGKYRCRGGRVVEVTSCDPSGEYPIHGTAAQTYCWMANGRFYSDDTSSLDLVSRIETPEPSAREDALRNALRWALEQIEDSLDPDHQAALEDARKALGE
jgi:hypothetical protein